MFNEQTQFQSVNEAIRALQTKVENLENEKRNLQESLRGSDNNNPLQQQKGVNAAAHVISSLASAENNSLREQV